MGVKFSEIEKVSERKLIIENGKPFWQENVLNGTINFNAITYELGKKIQQDVLSKLTKETQEDELAYMLIPYITDIEDDINLDRFRNMISGKNDIILVLKEGILDLFNAMIDYSNKEQKLEEKSKLIEQKIPNIDFNELKKQELEELYNKFANVSDKKERDEILKRVIELKTELGE